MAQKEKPGEAKHEERSEEAKAKRAQYNEAAQMKHLFFSKLGELKESAPHIVQLFESQEGKGAKKKQAEIIKNTFKKSADGSDWVVDLNNPYFKEVKSRWVLPTWKSL